MFHHHLCTDEALLGDINQPPVPLNHGFIRQDLFGSAYQGPLGHLLLSLSNVFVSSGFIVIHVYQAARTS